MNETDLIIGSMALVGVMTVVGRTQSTTPAPALRTAIGLFAATLVLTAGGEVAPQLAAGIAVLAATTAVFVYGGPAWNAVAKATK